MTYKPNIGDRVIHNSRSDVVVGSITEILNDGRVIAEFPDFPESGRYTHIPYATFSGIPAGSLRPAGENLIIRAHKQREQKSFEISSASLEDADLRGALLLTQEVIKQKIRTHNISLLRKLDPILSEINAKEPDFNEKATNPIIISYNKEYFDADLKIMIIGQETYTWNGEDNDGIYYSSSNLLDKIELLEERYNIFHWQNKRLEYGKVFSRVQNLIEEIENKLQPKTVKFLWNNLIKVGKMTIGAPKFFDKISAENKFAILDELDIFQPNFIIFLTGSSSSYESILKNIFSNPIYHGFSGYETEQIATIKINDINAIRTHHPNRRDNNPYKIYYKKIAEYIADCV